MRSLRRVLRIGLGLCLAVAVATLAVLLPSTIVALVQNDVRELRAVPERLIYWPFFIAVFAGAPTLGFILVSELEGWKRWPVHVGTGMFVALPGALLLVMTGSANPLRVVLFMIAIVVAGGLGAFAYWLVAGRSAGDWR